MPTVDGIIAHWRGRISRRKAIIEAYCEGLEELVAFANAVEDIELLQIMFDSTVLKLAEWTLAMNAFLQDAIVQQFLVAEETEDILQAGDAHTLALIDGTNSL